MNPTTTAWKKEILQYLIMQTPFIMFNEPYMIVYCEQLAHKVFRVGNGSITLLMRQCRNSKCIESNNNEWCLKLK